MKATFVKIDDLCNRGVDFYTVRFGENPLTEFELFNEKEFPNHEEELQQTYQIIAEIGDRGAKRYYFKEERGAHAIPKVSTETMENNQIDFGIRLYCIRINDSLLILLNGDIKTHKNPEQCSNVQKLFKNAVAIARKIDMLLDKGELKIQETDSLNDLEIKI